MGWGRLASFGGVSFPFYRPSPSFFFTRRSLFAPFHFFAHRSKYLVTESYSYLKEQAIVLRNMVATATAYESKKGAERAKQAATAAQVPIQVELTGSLQG